MQTFSRVYCLIHQSVIVFSLVFRHKSAAHFFSHVHVSFVFCGRNTVQFFSNVHICFVLRHRTAVQLIFVFVNFSNGHVCFVFSHDKFLYFVCLFCVLSWSVFVFNMSVLCSVKELLFSFLYLVCLFCVPPCLVFCIYNVHVFGAPSKNCCSVFSVFINFSNIHQVLAIYLNLRVYLIVLVLIGCVFILWYFALQFFCIFQF